MAKTENSPIYIGTSGWHYGNWKGNFYPEALSKKDFLDHYQQYLHTVEINSSFYRLPSEDSLKAWKDKVPQDFIFSVKASQYITHTKKLIDPEKTLEKIFETIQILKPRLGPVLFQLPPHWKCNLERLEIFLNQLPAGYRYAFEFRDPDWLNDDVYSLLRKKNCALCIYELNGFISPEELTADFIYVRLHGPDKAYQGLYDAEALKSWTKRFLEWQKKGKDIFCYFDNEQKGYAVANAVSLKEMVEKTDNRRQKAEERKPWDVGCGTETKEEHMKITSPAFEQGKSIPKKYTCQGDDTNPELRLEDIPEGTQSLALIVDDPDAPAGIWIHWVVYDIKPDTTVIDENSIPGKQGLNSFEKKDYGGPCPPSGEHRYFFKAFALDTMLNLDEEVRKKNVEQSMEGHILARCELMGTYKKT